jgi:hypothetical protein
MLTGSGGGSKFFEEDGKLARCDRVGDMNGEEPDNPRSCAAPIENCFRGVDHRPRANRHGDHGPANWDSHTSAFPNPANENAVTGGGPGAFQGSLG